MTTTLETTRAVPDVDALYLEHAPALRRIAFAEGLNDAAADDLVQRTFERYLSCEATVDLDRPMAPFPKTIARNLLRNDRRDAGFAAEITHTSRRPPPTATPTY